MRGQAHPRQPIRENSSEENGVPLNRHDMVRLVAEWARVADEGLARRAADNAAAGVAVVRARRLEEARTMRDLRLLDERMATHALVVDLREDAVASAPVAAHA
jgi:hypothetical protein